VQSHAGTLLWEPWHNLKKDGTPYKVFTPYYRNGLATQPAPVPAAKINLAELSAALHDCTQPNTKIDSLDLLPAVDWHESMLSHWTPGEAGAQSQLANFLEAGIEDYREGRDFPARMSVSRLSPHLHFGEISPNEAAFAANQSGQRGHESQAEHFVRELVWREFSYYLLYHFPSLTDVNMKSEFDRFPWLDEAELRSAWQRGMTGYPIIDAGMRELYTTGYMHNRVRMIVASFLIKNLMQDWRHGEKWFWDCLVDADLASNSCSWQWVAGSGADAAPYFRIFNPVTQSQKFDPDGEYIRRFVPELARLPAKYLHDPSAAPAMELSLAGIELGKDYPAAIVDLKQTRERALAAYKTLRD
jgi:deoxyribodipyrimidine photo-lyase